MTPAQEDRMRAKIAAAADGVRFDVLINLDGRHHAADLVVALAALDEARRERDAYKRAKAENDDRFMSERDEARIRCREAAEVLIEAVGADGPCDVGDAARRAVEALANANVWLLAAQIDRDLARLELCALLDGHLSPSDAARAASITRATAARRGWGM